MEQNNSFRKDCTLHKHDSFHQNTVKTGTKHTRQDIRSKDKRLWYVFVVSTNGDVCVDLSSVCSSGCCMVAPPAAAAGG